MIIMKEFIIIHIVRGLVNQGLIILTWEKIIKSPKSYEDILNYIKADQTDDD